MKKVYFVISWIALIACLRGISYLVEGIKAKGLGGVNYGRIVFPLLIGGVCFRQFRRKK